MRLRTCAQPEEIIRRLHLEGVECEFEVIGQRRCDGS